MALTKKNYVDNQTVITADNMNAMQDAIIGLEKAATRSGCGAPTANTEGAVGVIYIDADTGEKYKCTAVADGTYTWEKVADSSQRVNLPLNEDGTPNYGTAGYYAVSDGAGGITWVSAGNSGGSSGDDSGQNPNCLLTVETITIGEPGNIPVTGITLDYSNISLTAGDTMMLAASVAPSDATNNTVLWESSNTGVATVDNGLVTAVSAGNAVITAKSAENNSIKATCSVAVASASGTVKTQLSSLGMVDGLMKKDAKTVYTVASGYHVEVPYIDGMTISTCSNAAWIANYPPFIVRDNDVVTIPDHTTGNGTAANTPGTNYITTLTGFSASAKVYVNIYATGVGNVTVQEAMNSADSYYYTYEA